VWRVAAVGGRRRRAERANELRRVLSAQPARGGSERELRATLVRAACVCRVCGESALILIDLGLPLLLLLHKCISTNNKQTVQTETAADSGALTTADCFIACGVRARNIN